jgi:hypothetical protein
MADRELLTSMIRIQIRLEEVECLSAKIEAGRLGISISEFIRRAVREKLDKVSAKPWMRYAGMVTSENSESSLSIDDVVYRRD